MAYRNRAINPFVIASILFVAETSTQAADLVSFELDVMPVLSAAGCNAGACHGKQRGQNGFQLSLLGFDADFDYEALVHQGRGRRVSPAAPDSSLLLLKGSARVPHGGGPRLDRSSPLYAVIRKWIAQGMPRSNPEEPKLQGIVVEPVERILELHETQQLSVTANYSDGSSRDVTHVATFQSNEPAIVAVDKVGLLRAGSLAGEASIMVRYMGNIATWNTAIPHQGDVSPDHYEHLPRWSFIDEFVWTRLKQLKMEASPPVNDATFLRRAHLDIIGRLPTPVEAREFLQDQDPNKRRRLIDRLLERPEYADHWASKWADLLRPNPYRVGIKATLNLDAWIRDVFRRNLPYDEWVHQLVTAQGSTWRNGAATLFRDRRQPEEITTAVSQLFLGVRLECAKCHHHPFEVWGQDDFYGMAAYFARVGRKGSGISPPISGGEEIVYTNTSGNVNHPITGKSVAPKPLFGVAREVTATEDPRKVLAEWLVSSQNEYFARAGANRIWAELMGRGLVEPVDDLRATNPASNGPLLAALAEEFRRVEFDQKEFIRSITNSYVYQLSSTPRTSNTSDRRNYSRHYRQQMRAEVLLDAVCDVTGIGEAFVGESRHAVPPDTRAAEAWTFRLSSPFLDAFGRPDANQDPPCERIGDSTVVQALHMMNAQHMHDKVTNDQGRAAKLAESDLKAGQILDELYLSAYSRYPNAEEHSAAEPLFGASTDQRRKATEDLMWAVLNTPEFLLKN